MLRNASEMHGYAVAGTDGRLGTVSDFLFDDARWQVRWLVVDTGTWLSGRKVLLPSFALGHADATSESFTVRLSKQQITDSPDIDSEQPVSRQMEANVFDYYGWSPYWGSGYFLGGYGYEGGAIASTPALEPAWSGTERRSAGGPSRDPHLRSISEVTGYHIEATDGEIGHVNDFIIEDTDWTIHLLLVSTRNWWPGKKVLISPYNASRIDWAARRVQLKVDRQQVQNSPTYDDQVTIDRAFEHDLRQHYSSDHTHDKL